MNKPFHLYEKSIVFDMFLWINKNHNWTTNQDIFRDICLRHQQGRTLVFIFRDGDNPELSGATAVIGQIAQEANISPDRIIFLTYNKIYAPFAKLEQLDTTDVFAPNPWPPERHYPINNTAFDKKFSALFGRFSIYRLRAAKFLHDTYRNDTLLSFKDYPPYIIDQLRRVGDFYQDELRWVQDNFPLPSVDGIPATGWPLSIGTIIDGIGRIYTRYLIDITVETDVHNPIFITEKTARNFFYGKPFIVFAGQGYLSNIRKLGFETFPELINESYDLIENTEDRFQAFIQAIKDVAAKSDEELKQIVQEMQPKFEHNRELLVKRKMTSDRLLWAPSYENSLPNLSVMHDIFSK